MKEIEVEGFKVVIEKSEGGFTVSVPKLPGCATQVEREEDAPREIRAVIGLYLRELTANQFTPKKAAPRPEARTGKEGDAAGRKARK